MGVMNLLSVGIMMNATAFAWGIDNLAEIPVDKLATFDCLFVVVNNHYVP